MNTENDKDKYKDNDKEFIDQVWKKVNYIQYEKDRLEETKEVEKSALKKKHKILLYFIMSIIAFVPILFAVKFDIVLVVLVSIYILGFCCYYENYLYS